MNQDEKTMQNEGYVYVKIPAKLAQSLNIEAQKIQVFEEDDGLLLAKPAKTDVKGISIKYVAWSVLSYIITVFAIFNGNEQVLLTGPNSIANLVIAVGLVTSVISFSIAFAINKKRTKLIQGSEIHWRHYPVILFSHGVMVLLILLLAFRVLGEVFLGVSFDLITASLIGGTMVGVLNYFMAMLAQSLTPNTLIRTLVFIILGGVLIAMITNSDHQWWLYNLSFLGTPEAVNAWQFNATLMVSALLMIALIDYLFSLMYETYGPSRRFNLLKFLLAMIALCLGGVGLFPYNENVFSQTMHNRVAGYLIYLFILLIILIRWLVPFIPKAFLKLSYSVCALLIVSVYLFLGLSYLSLTAFELIAFVLAFSWLLLLLKVLIDGIQTYGKSYDLEVVNSDYNKH